MWPVSPKTAIKSRFKFLCYNPSQNQRIGEKSTSGEKPMTTYRIRAAMLLFLLFALLACASIYLVNPEVISFRQPTETPTFAISATPSITPAPTTTPTRTPDSQAEASATPTITAEEQEASPTPTPTPDSQAETSATPTITAEEAEASPTPKIVLPTATSSVTLHIVRPGESLCQIALLTYGQCVKWSQIWAANGQFPKPHLIHPGQELVVP